MPKFKLTCEVTVSAYTVVTAKTAEEAIRIASGREPVIGLLHTSHDSAEEWIIEEADGEPTNIRLD